MDFAVLLKMLNVIARIVLKACLDKFLHLIAIVEAVRSKPQQINHINLKELSHVPDASPLPLSYNLNDVPIRVHVLGLKS